MSKLEVDAIEPQSGTTITIGASGDTLTVPSGATLNVVGTLVQSGDSGFTGAVTITTTDNSDTLTLKSTDADANVGPNLILQRDSGSPADGDSIGRIDFDADNDAGQVTSFFSIRSEIEDASDGTEDGQLKIDQIIAGTTATILRFKSTETVFNDDSKDVDFRVESNGNTNMLFVDGGNDAVGIGTSTPPFLLSLSGSSQGISFTDTSGGTNAKAWLMQGLDSDFRLRTQLDDYSGGELAILIARTAGVVNNHQFYTEDSERMRLTTTGLGIGTSSPTTTLDVDLSGTGETLPIVLSNRNTTAGTGQKTTLGFGLARNSGAFKSQAGTIEVGREQDWTSADTNIDSYMAFSTYLNNAGTEKLRIHSSGKVSIGTTTAEGILKLDNTGQTSETLLTTEDTGGSGAHSHITLKNTTGTVASLLTTSDNLEFRVDDATVFANISGSEHMRITSAGYVGIGTSSPQRELHVQGNDGASGTSPGNSDSQIFIDNDGGNGAMIEFGASNDGAGRIMFSDEDATNRGKIEYVHSSDHMQFSTANTERMRIDSSGQVGIGTSSPTAKLNVDGAIVGGQKGDSSPNNTDVSGVNSLTVSTGAGAQTINGLVGGVTGQVLHIIKTNSAFTLTIADQNATSPGVDIKTADGNNISLTNFGGVTLLFYNGAWWEVGK